VAQLPTTRIDRSSPVPFYFQLKQLLVEEMTSGRWRPGEQLPSEPSLCAHFEVSRTTVRQALAQLGSEGMIRKEKGRGTFIAQPRPTSWLLQSSHGFFDEATAAGRTVTSRVLTRDVVKLPRWATDALQLLAGTRGVVVERLRWVDDQLVMYVITYLPQWLAGTLMGAELERGSLYRTLEDKEGLIVTGGRRVVEAVVGRDDLATQLEVESGAPLLFVESVSWDQNGRPFECYRAWHRADRTKIEVQVVHHEIAARAGFDANAMRIGAM
jgi:GntR family transcriptional regulator